MVEVESGVDLLALEKLMATLRDWLVTCQASVPAIYTVSALSPTPIDTIIPPFPA
jgi:hypothetical protein